MSALEIKRRIFIWALWNYVLHSSISPHISTNALCSGILKIVDGFIVLQHDGKLENDRPGARWVYAHDIRKLASELSKAVETYMKDK